MGKFKDYLMLREAKRELNGKKTFFEWVKDKLICLEAKKELKKIEKQNKKEMSNEKC